ncbi:C10 family peptidase [Chitinophaga qingshengii]|uniref:C10 family peptidase n=1 Tax=Chitinophaga qingshengii TaxID=1569794 RepID=A0ABR7TXI6_9BACT|nr:C10 family peptidase [Chitinophaga qingshengii]MBC9934139.1 C10 family peptidase [Chitinophaga qingshengii]
MPPSNCPNGSPNAPYPAGCFVIAAAQVQAYYRPNLQVNINGAATPFQWDAMLSTPYGGDEATNQNTRNHLTSFIKNVFNGCATTPSCDGSSTNSTSGIAYLRQTLNVNNGIGINMTDIKNSLDQLKLVLATGFREPNNDGNPKVGHAWVVDGYAVTSLNPGETIVGNNVWQRYNMYLHCNMGWGSFWSGSGWYLVGKDNVGSLTFASNSAQKYKINLTFFSNISKK